jgi:large subunit ribosomal protein L4
MVTKIEQIPEWLSGAAEGNLGTLWQVVKSYQSNRRQGTVGVKTRSLVKATGKKAFKQKKTGNARHGAMTSNIFVGGGVSHGPQARSYREAIPVGMARKALAIALSKRIAGGNVFVGSLEVASGKTKDAVRLASAGLQRVGKTLVVLKDPAEETIRAFRNIRGVVLVQPEQVTALDIMETRNLITTEGGMQILQERVEKSKSKKQGGAAR